MARDKFGSSLGTLLVMAGSAVGLGNIWRFPYMVGEYGGAAFILIYVAAIIAAGVPILLCEFIVGRRSRSNPVNAFYKLSGNNPFWKFMGKLLMIAPFIITGYYSVVGGWTLGYLGKACVGSFSPSLEATEITAMFGALVSSPWRPLLWHIVFLGVCVFVSMCGVKKGIEAFSKVMMPLLFVIMIIVAVWTMTLPGAQEGLRYLFRPDFSQIGSKTILAAFGQAFFSLSLGCGTMITYASYSSSGSSVFSSSLRIAFFDLLFAIIAGCAVMCAVFAYGLEVGEGTGLVFETLPIVFSRMPLGGLTALLFFIVLVLAAVTSEISMVEVCVTFLSERFSLSRKTACLIVFVFGGLLGVFCSLSLGPLTGLKISGLSLFDTCDSLSANYFMLLGGLLTVIFVGWAMKKSDVKDEFTNGGKLKGSFFALEYFLIKYLAPISVIAIFIGGILGK